MHRITRRACQLLLAGALTTLAATGIAQAQDDVPGVTKTEIRVGQLGPQTGPAAAYDGVRQGIKAYFDYVNANGGVDGRKLKLYAYDDQYQPAKAVQMMHRLVEQDHVFATLGDVGSPTNAAVEDYVRKHQIPMINLCSMASRFFEPPIANYMGACSISYATEAKAMVYYAIEKLGAKRIAIAYDNDDYGTPIKDVMIEALKNYPDAEMVQVVNFQAGDSDLSSQAQKLRSAKPDAILVASVPPPAAHLKKALYRIGVNSDNTQFLTTQEAGNYKTVFELAGQEVWDGSYSIAVMPTLDQTDNEQVQLFIKQFTKSFPDAEISGAPSLGWASGQVFVEALKRTKDLTRENFLNSFYTFDNWQGSMYAGVTFTKDNHWGLNTMFITQAKDGKIVPISGRISLDPDSGEFVEHGSAD